MDPATLHVIFTGVLACTLDEGDHRYHARTLVGANPFLVSLQGIVEGPARPRGYYAERLAGLYAAAMAGGRAPDAGDVPAKDAGKYDYVTRGDCRMPDVARGYLLQAVAYFETGEAFCQDDACRMYNAHWQSEVIRTQVSSPRLCARHRENGWQDEGVTGRTVAAAVPHESIRAGVFEVCCTRCQEPVIRA